MIKQLWKRKPVKRATLTATPIIAFLLAVILVVTQNTFIYETIASVLGTPVAHYQGGAEARYAADYATKEDALAAANALVEEIEEEGIVMLKNETSLPLHQGAKVTVFGKNSVNLILGGSGSSSKSTKDQATIYSSLADAGFTVNPVMESFYRDNRASGNGRGTSPSMSSGVVYGFATGETPLSSYTQTQRDSYQDYADAAIVVISRIGGEGYDLPRSMATDASLTTAVEGAASPTDHYLELDQNEKDMLQEACNHFDNVILVLNTSTSMELGFLDTPDMYEGYDFTKVKSALVIGYVGGKGVNALGRVLNGTVNPSGHLPDTYARDFTQDPSYSNIGYYRSSMNGKEQNAYFVEYEEGIYVGYRYYETRGYTDGEAWYHEHVVFPLGYGLSYTTFDWALVGVQDENGKAVQPGDAFGKDRTLIFTVKVTNTGDVAGKDVVQLYTTAPYIAGEIEKAHVVLSDFAKTSLLAPGASEEVQVSVQPYDFASYDYSDANANGFKGYELDAGDYSFKLMRDAHTSVIDDFTLTLSAGVTFPNDPDTDYPVENLFDEVSDHITTYLSRADWEGTMPKSPTEDELTVDADFIKAMRYKINDQESDLWYTDVMPTQAASSNADPAIKLPQLIGKDYDDPLWDELLDQLTVEEIATLVSIGNYQTVAMPSINKPGTIDPDGPGGFVSFFMSADGTSAVYDTCTYCGETVLASTYNKSLARRMGEMVGNEGLLGDQRTGVSTPYSGWYGPAMNIHRSQFGGRNWEYYSEDGVLSAKMAAEVVSGAASKGVYAYLKHFAINEQETNRDNNGLINWFNEQSMREIYLKPFETCVKTGDCTAVMSSFTRFGAEWAGGCYRLLTTILRNEWGFRGFVVTDYGIKSYLNADQMLRAGGDLSLAQFRAPSSMSTATDVSVIRQAAKNILYTVANSNAMNNIAEDTVIYYTKPVWEIASIAGVSAVCALLAAWCVCTWIREAKKLRKQSAA